MRISTGMIYESGLASIQNRTSTLLNVQQQLSTGRRILRPSDDPVAAARALEVTQSLAANKAQATTRDNVKSAVGIADAQLQSTTDLLARVRELTVQAGSAALSAQDRRSIALELRQRFDELVAIANAKDGIGNSLFGGFQVGNKPFAGSVENGVRYLGDDGLRGLQVSNARQMGISQSGNDIFMRIANGNGTFATSTQNEKSTNASHITYEGLSASLTNPPATTGSFELKFWTDTAGGNAPRAAQAVGTQIIPNGITFTDATDDQFTITIDGVGHGIDLSVAGATVYATPADLVTVIQGQIGAAGTVNLDTTGRLVVTSATSGAPASSVAFTDGPGTPATTLFGVPTITPASNGAASTTYYDMVDSSGNSLFTGTASTTGGTGNTYTHAYSSGTPFSLISSGPLAFDYRASVVFTGIPADGDSFAVDRSATTLGISEKSITSSGARATINAGTVSDPFKWSQAANSGDLEVRFWVDTQGTVATGGQTVGTVAPTFPLIVTAGNGDQFDISIDGGATTTITLTPGNYATLADVVADIQPIAGATVSEDGNGHLVFTSNTTGAASSVQLTDVNGALPRIYGADTGVPTVLGGTLGTAAAAGRTFYDLVDASTGKSLYTNTTSTTGLGGTYNHLYTSGALIDLASPGGMAGQIAFDFGADVVISGIPAGGDAFTIKSSQDYTGNGYFVTAAKTTTAYNTGSGIIGEGDILDEAKWNHPANSRNLEVRFWQDPEDLSDPPTTYYDLVDAETEKSLFTNGTSTAGGTGNSFTHVFKSGDAIDFSGLGVTYGLPVQTITDFGISVTINGQPATGDAFKIRASESQSVFDTLAKTILLLESGKPIETMGNVQLSNEIGSILSGLSRAEDSILSARAVFGTRLAEVDSLDSVGEDLNIQFEETLSRLQDLDYAEAITKLTRQQMELQAAQQSFSRISQLTLFDYLR